MQRRCNLGAFCGGTYGQVNLLSKKIALGRFGPHSTNVSTGGLGARMSGAAVRYYGRKDFSHGRRAS